jgi:hypothetical protein
MGAPQCLPPENALNGGFFGFPFVVDFGRGELDVRPVRAMAECKQRRAIPA